MLSPGLSLAARVGFYEGGRSGREGPGVVRVGSSLAEGDPRCMARQAGAGRELGRSPVLESMEVEGQDLRLAEAALSGSRHAELGFRPWLCLTPWVMLGSVTSPCLSFLIHKGRI